MTAMDFNTALKRRRILQELTVDKIAAVDRPAQEGANAVIMKRADEPPVDAFTKAQGDFEACVDRIQKRDNSTRLAAIMKATNEHPDEWSRYGEAGKDHVVKAERRAPVETRISKAFDSIRKMDDQLEDLVRKQQRPDETFAKAYDRVLREQPSLYTGRCELVRAHGYE
ncbi:hypothetical protein FJ417_24645 [Mesorhizobium sp. B3-1-7]|uniref:hypothetical protein n=1 Tax=Mesorhizobium sp. B3-1-7 TaxID=2589894 RepID=UPI00112882DD|nr:hypothetical protein [Mesorhizobium sp. B3-1-7]TPI54742.1 hypothetical protein FJ417_24645 [Mesorhizobium sp. B3-1-7]